MKKVLAIALIAGAMVACNNSGDKKADTKDSTTIDTNMNPMNPGDSNTMPQDTMMPAPDSTGK